MTKRQSILAYFQTAVQEIAGMGDVDIERVDPEETPALGGAGSNYPAVNIYPGHGELKPEESSSMMDEWDQDIHLDVITMDSDLEDLLGNIDAAVLTPDRTLGGLADYVKRQSPPEKNVKFDPSSHAQAMTITYTVSYEVPTGTA